MVMLVLKMEVLMLKYLNKNVIWSFFWDDRVFDKVIKVIKVRVILGGEDCVGWDVDIGVGAGVNISDIITFLIEG